MKVSTVRYEENLETYQIYGGESLSIEIDNGDHVEIVDVEGDQPCTLLALDMNGSSIIESLSWKTKPIQKNDHLTEKNLSNSANAILKKKILP